MGVFTIILLQIVVINSTHCAMRSVMWFVAQMEGLVVREIAIVQILMEKSNGEGDRG